MIFGRFGPVELVLVLAIALLIFGPKKIPEIGKAIGRTIKEFKKGSKADNDDQAENAEESEPEQVGEDGQEPPYEQSARTKKEEKQSS